MPRIAFTTFAIAIKPFTEPALHGFLALEPAVFRKAEVSPGFIARARGAEEFSGSSIGDAEMDFGPWGSMVAPAFYTGGGDLATETRASTLSLWKDVESVYAFAYSGLHRTAFAQREKWFEKPRWPNYAMWWVGDTHVPTWQEAALRLECLHANGPTPYAFNFRCRYDYSGNIVVAQDQTRPSQMI